MSELKCPFCHQELCSQSANGEWLECWNCSYSEPNNRHLPQPILGGSRELWQEFIRTRKELDVALNCLNGVVKDLPWVKRTLEQITALEQKD